MQYRCIGVAGTICSQKGGFTPDISHVGHEGVCGTDLAVSAIPSHVATACTYKRSPPKCSRAATLQISDRSSMLCHHGGGDGEKEGVVSPQSPLQSRQGLGTANSSEDVEGGVLNDAMQRLYDDPNLDGCKRRAGAATTCNHDPWRRNSSSHNSHRSSSGR